MWEPALETMPREALDRLVVERMRSTLGHIARNAAYARRLRDVKPGDVKQPADWQRLPFLTKDEPRHAYPFGLACGTPGASRRIHMSSGTTGNPILNPYTDADVAQWGDVM